MLFSMRPTLSARPMLVQMETALVESAVLKLSRGPISTMKLPPVCCLLRRLDTPADSLLSKFGVRIHWIRSSSLDDSFSGGGGYSKFDHHQHNSSIDHTYLDSQHSSRTQSAPSSLDRQWRPPWRPLPPPRRLTVPDSGRTAEQRPWLKHC